MVPSTILETCLLLKKQFWTFSYDWIVGLELYKVM